MIHKDYNIDDVLQYVTADNYDEWIKVLCAVKNEGFNVDVFDHWSSRQYGYTNTQDTYRKWKTFNGASFKNIGIGSLIAMAKQNGYKPTPQPKKAKEVTHTVKPVVNSQWIEKHAIPEPIKSWENDLALYLKLLFKPKEYVSYNVDFQTIRNKLLPSGHGVYNQTSEELLTKLTDTTTNEVINKDNLSDINQGGFIRFNPMDGKGDKDANVTEYRHALIESDNMSMEDQYALLIALKIPITVLVHSGNKSLHAIVKIDAGKNFEVYQSRVNFLYEFLNKNGFTTDRQNRNPSRLSRMPGLYRDINKQYIVDINLGMNSWDEWESYIEDLNGIPIETDTAMSKENPQPMPILIDGLLREKEIMQLAGPSGIGKSFLLLNLALSISAGKNWLGFKCKKAKCLYLNFEIDRGSFNTRCREMRQQLLIEPSDNLLFSHLRGVNKTKIDIMDDIVRVIKKHNINVIFIDPVYRVHLGDENSNQDVGSLCEYFNTLLSCNTSIIYAHHYSKGAQGSKAAIDRNSGAGVFSRDANTMLAFSRLEDSAGMKLEVAKLRDFPIFPSKGIVFEYPMHVLAPDLDNADIEGTPASKKKQSSRGRYVKAYNNLYDTQGGKVTEFDIANYLDISIQAVNQALRRMDGIFSKNGKYIDMREETQ